jgi:Zn-dependent peptidase ImmA (M78 family)/transcriptional regulator with XRE-family HTH domain
MEGRYCDVLFDSPQAHPAMLVLAREAAAMTQTELARSMAALADGDVSQGYVSRAESGRLTVTGERLELYARALGCTGELLCLDPQAAQIGVGLIHHRKKAALSAPALRCIHARLALTRIEVASLLETAGAVPDDDQFIRVALDDYTLPRDAAARVRQAWGVAPGPILDLVAGAEHAGAVVLLRDLGTVHLDAVSVWNGGEPPLLLVNSCAPADRRRFSIAHEIGHLVMHQVPGGMEQEKQADEFAAALLMPAADIRGEFAGAVDLARLLELKARWGASMSALAKRAQSLGFLSDWQYRNLMIEMSALGYRTGEPGTLEPERPFRVREAIEALRIGKDMTDTEIAERMHLRPEDFAHFYAPEHAGRDAED